jgi:N-acetyl-1-D-myo-inositol-2-amino-2-deoxy-alpha-D-glucopyranoside deacetylase
MMGEPSNDREGSFWRADLREAADHLVAVIRETRPQVLVTYDDFGGYGHPDHIQAHRVATYAAVLAAVPTYRPDLGEPWDIQRWYWTAFPKSAVRRGIELLKEAGDSSDFAAMDPDDLPFAVDDDVIAVAVDVVEQLPAKRAAMAAHASQINLAEGFFALSNNEGMPVFDREYFRIAKGDLPSGGPHTDLFVGIPE